MLFRSALALVGPFWFLTLRFGLAALLLTPFARRPETAQAGSAGFVIGLLLFLGYALQTLGLQHTSASRAGFLTGLTVVFVPVGVALLHQRRPSRPLGAGIMLAVGGTALLSGSSQAGASSLLGDLLVLGCALAFTSHILILGRVAAQDRKSTRLNSSHT